MTPIWRTAFGDDEQQNAKAESQEEEDGGRTDEAKREAQDGDGFDGDEPQDARRSIQEMQPSVMVMNHRKSQREQERAVDHNMKQFYAEVSISKTAWS
jgi:hypothetical protein